jgi:hypothetical protein
MKCVWVSGVLVFGVAAFGSRVAKGDPSLSPAGAPLPGFSEALELHASDVELDPRTRALVLRGDVRVDASPFHLRADLLAVHRTARGAIVVEGAGRVAFCPCLGAPLALRFSEATLAPPADLFLRSPSLEVAGAPVFWLPYFWLRTPDKLGLLPPDVAYRGMDGMFLGDGVHLPLHDGSEGSALDLRAGGYFEGGAAFDVRATTATTSTHLDWDHLRGDGVTVDARGYGEKGAATLAWDLDAIRGARGVLATTALDAAARPFDRAAAESSWRSDGWTLATAYRATASRGSNALDVGASGPVATLRWGGALGGAGAADAAIEGGGLSEPGMRVSYARGEAGALLADRWGPVGASLALRGAGDAVQGAADSGVESSGIDGAASARARLALPFGRSFASGEPNDPWVHRVEPAVEGAVLSTHGDGLLGVAPGRGLAGVQGDAWVTGVALASEQGRWGARVGSDVSVSAGAVGAFGAGESARFVTRGHAALSAAAAGVTAEGARVWNGGAAGEGGAFVARVRVGDAGGLHLIVTAAERDGVDPVVARALTDAPLEPSGGFLASTGWTGGAGARVPWLSWLATTGGVDGDLTAKVLVAARGGLELRDRCGCVLFRANAAHRIGRDGVDAWVTLDLVPR